MNELHKKIYNILKYTGFDNTITAAQVKELIGLDGRMLAAQVRKMNELYKGEFHIGSTKDKGYWLCKDEEEALVSMMAYRKTILSMLGENKRIKEQIRLTFGNRDLFGERVLRA